MMAFQYGAATVLPIYLVIGSKLTHIVNIYCRDIDMADLNNLLELTLLYSTSLQQLTVFDYENLSSN